MPKIVTRGRCLGHIWALGIYHPAAEWRDKEDQGAMESQRAGVVFWPTPAVDIIIWPFGRVRDDCVCRRQRGAAQEAQKASSEKGKSSLGSRNRLRRVGQLDL